MNAEATATEELVAGKYRLTRLIGRGGMGSVWEGIHVSLGTRVAVKFIDTEYINSEELRARFANEARAAAKLVSKHVVQVFDHGLCADGRSYMVMEFLAGEALDSRLDRMGRLSPADTVRIIGQVCRGLVKAHAAGIVHRDLKPENIFLVWDEEDGADIVKVVDFGIAKFTDGAAGASSATRTGSVLGTPFYMSPEQARGLRTVDRRTDLWALGVVTYRCLVGALPFEGEALGDLLVKICTAPLPVPSQQLPGLPQSFDRWFFRALERDADKRFSNAAEFAETLCLALGFSGASKHGPAPYNGSGELGAATAPGGPWSPSGMGPARSGVYPGGSTPGTGPREVLTQAAPVVGRSPSYAHDARTADVSAFAAAVPRRPRATLVAVGVVVGLLLLLIFAGVGYKIWVGSNRAPSADEATGPVEATPTRQPTDQPQVAPAVRPATTIAAPTPAPSPEPEAATPKAVEPSGRTSRAARPQSSGSRAQASSPQRPRAGASAEPAPPPPARTPASRPREVDLGY